MPYDDVLKFSNAAKGKATLLKEHPGKYFIRAIMAGFFIAVAMIYNNVVGNIFKDSDPAWGKMLGGLVFSIAVLLIVFIGSELFTGNNLVMAFGAFDKAVTWKQVGKVWLVSYIGNFVGCAFFSLIFVASGASGTADYFAGYIENKLALPMDQMFFKAILCNFFVCLAVACGIKCKDEVAKFLMITICISGFIVSGFEHCVANMATFTTAYFLVPGLSIGAILKSMLIVTTGNIIGGSLLLALPLRKMSADK
ncbi:MAG TPA: formate/nitrite transporter family protein [Candidatus Pelethocola excrementipullorum]|nr:formate/nitrite transporter family protein [Candidatus Pelethocola excrementipullorum]